MNTLIKRNMKFALVLAFIGACVVPVCAQKNIGKAAKNIGKKGAANTFKGSNVLKPGVTRYQVRIPGSTAKYYVSTTSNAFPRLSDKVQGSLVINVAPKTKVALTDTQLRAGLERKATQVRLEDATPIQLLNAAHLWLKENPGKTLAENPVLQEKVEKLMIQKKPNFELLPLLPFLKETQNSGISKSLPQLAAEDKEYPNNVTLDKWGFPKKSTINVKLDTYLLAADPVEMGAFVVNPALLESVEISRSGLFLTEEERVAAETLIGKRLERLTNLPAEYTSPREVLQEAYNYFATQQKLTKGNLREMNFAYRYRTDLPFEKLTTAEKEGFLVHKLIRLQLKRDLEAFKNGVQNGMVSIDMYMQWSTDTAHLRLLDYVASKNASTAIDKTDMFYDTKEGLRTVLEAYNDLRTISTRWTKYYGHDWLNNDVVKRAVELLDSDLYKTSLETRRELYHLFPQSLKKTHRVK